MRVNKKDASVCAFMLNFVCMHAGYEHTRIKVIRGDSRVL